MPNMSAFELVVAAIGVVALWIFFASRWHRLERVPRRPSFLTPLMGFIIVVLLLVGGGIGLSTARWMFSIGEEIEDESHPVRATAIIITGAHVAQFIVLTLLVWLWSQSRRPIRETRPSHRAAAMLGIGAFILAWPIVLLVSLVVNVIIMIVTGEPVEPIAHDTLLLFREHDFDGWMILLIVLVALSAPLIEEVMYRGVVQESLRQLGLSRWTAIVLTSVFFAAMHWPVIEPHAVATLFVLSLGFGWVYERSGRLAAPVAMHAAFNVGNLTLVMMMH